MNLELAKFEMKAISFRPDENKGPVIVLIGRRERRATHDLAV